MYIKSLPFSISACLLLTACAVPSTMLQNANGEVVNCSASGFGLLGTAAALALHSDCVDRMQTAGYRPVNEGSIAPRLSPEASSIGIHLSSEWEHQNLTEAMVSSGGIVYALNRTADTGVLVSVASREGVTDLMAYGTSRRANLEKNC